MDGWVEVNPKEWGEDLKISKKEDEIEAPKPPRRSGLDKFLLLLLFAIVIFLLFNSGVIIPCR